MRTDLGEPPRVHLVGEHDHFRHAKLPQIRDAGPERKRGECSCRAIVAPGDDARVSVDERMPEASRCQHAVDVQEGLLPAGERKADNYFALARAKTVEDWR